MTRGYEQAAGAAAAARRSRDAITPGCGPYGGRRTPGPAPAGADRAAGLARPAGGLAALPARARPARVGAGGGGGRGGGAGR